ncbi:MAG: Hsp20/alpha crystallin family protein [Lachnospiraceae bacterium]|nr:Hsp20/alpha crystallin family protein [Lachnospiraceae bacterium]
MLRPSIFADNFVDSMFDEFMRDPFWPEPHSGHGPMNMMNTDIKETDAAYQIEMELPGFSKEDVQADLKDGYLTIEAKRTETSEDKGDGEKYLRRERYTGECRRSFYVGEEVTQADIQAKFTDGVLMILVPKKEAKPAVEEKKYIQIGD